MVESWDDCCVIKNEDIWMSMVKIRILNSLVPLFIQFKKWDGSILYSCQGSDQLPREIHQKQHAGQRGWLGLLQLQQSQLLLQEEMQSMQNSNPTAKLVSRHAHQLLQQKLSVSSPPSPQPLRQRQPHHHLCRLQPALPHPLPSRQRKSHPLKGSQRPAECITTRQEV